MPVSVEERDNPGLVGQPVIVGGTAEARGVVAAANYAARKFGVHSAMPAARAKRLCPQAVFLPTRIDYYASISQQIREILERFTPLVEPLSLDEAFLDVAGCERLFGPAPGIAGQIKQRIHDEVRLIASVGVAPNKFLAKIASDVHKPDGLVVVEAHQVQDFLDPLPVGRLWGVGRVTGQVFDRLGIQTIGQLRQMSAAKLSELFGSAGEHYWRLAHGIDDRPVVPDREAKSISHETTFAEDLRDRESLRAWLLVLTEQVGQRLRRNRLQGRTVHLKIRFGDFRTITRSHTLPQPTNVTREIWHTAAEMLEAGLPETSPGVRLLGVGVSGFENPDQVQQALFADDDQQKQSRVDSAADQLRAKFGGAALGRASGLLRRSGNKGQRDGDSGGSSSET